MNQTGVRMDRKYQVFISSTYKNLKAARKHASDAILSMGHFSEGDSFNLADRFKGQCSIDPNKSFIEKWYSFGKSD